MTTIVRPLVPQPAHAGIDRSGRSGDRRATKRAPTSAAPMKTITRDSTPSGLDAVVDASAVTAAASAGPVPAAGSAGVDFWLTPVSASEDGAGTSAAGAADAAYIAAALGAGATSGAVTAAASSRAPAVPPEAKPPEATRTPTMPRAASPVPSGVANANRGPENAARKPRMPDGRSEAACSGVSRKSRGRTGAGSSGMAAAIARRSWWRAAHSVQPATRAVACSSAGPGRRPPRGRRRARGRACRGRVSGMWGISRPPRGTGPGSPRAGRGARAGPGGCATSPCRARRP